MTISQNIKQVQQQINTSNVMNKSIQIVAATKYVDAEKIKELFENGITLMGENRVEPLLEKKSKLTSLPIEWHFIGTLQSRKVKEIINEIDVLHSLDRLSLAKEISRHRRKPLKCFVQVNVSEERSKHGLKTEEVIPFIEALAQFEKIEVIGLMTMAPNTEDERVIRHCFEELRYLQQYIISKTFSHAPCQELSMGMSNDFTIAIEEGATYVRLGSVLFQ